MKSINLSYRIDYENHTIIATKKFLKEAGSNINSEAYKTLRALRIDLPNFQIVPKEIKQNSNEQDSNKHTYGKLTYDAMREQIKLRESKENTPKVLAEFETIIKLSKIHAGSYAFVKDWFLARYKEQIEAEAKFEKESEETNEQANKTETPVLAVVG